MLTDNKQGLGFGCGSEPLPGIFAKHGCKIAATDLAEDAAREQGWVDTLQHANDLDNLYNACNRVLDKSLFLENVIFENIDMNNLPEKLNGYDFVWSACAFEHLGSLRHGMEFVKKSIKCLKPGGIAVHTTEFNLSSNGDTFETPGCSVYREKDIKLLVAELEAEGYEVEPLCLNHGEMAVDKYIDIPPYGFSPHLKLQLEQYVITSIGLVVKRVF